MGPQGLWGPTGSGAPEALELQEPSTGPVLNRLIVMVLSAVDVAQKPISKN